MQHVSALMLAIIRSVFTMLRIVIHMYSTVKMDNILQAEQLGFDSRET